MEIITHEKAHVTISDWRFNFAITEEIWWYIAGIVIGHRKIQDYHYMVHSSEILHAELDPVDQEVLVETRNTIFHGSLKECDYSAETNYKFMPKLQEYATIYAVPDDLFSTAPQSALVVFSDRYQHYFRYAVINQNGCKMPVSKSVYQDFFVDSILLQSDVVEEHQRLEMRYQPHQNNIIHLFGMYIPESYTFYIENSGDHILTVCINGLDTRPMDYVFQPGQRINMTEEYKNRFLGRD